MSWTENDTVLRNLLASLYSDGDQAVRLAEQAGIPRSFIASSGLPIQHWHAILSETKKRGLLAKLVAEVLKEYPDHVELKSIASGVFPKPAPVSGIDWRGGPDPSLEKIIGARSTLLPIRFLQAGIQASKAVARIRVSGGYGTGFLLDGNLLVTNHHVIPDVKTASDARVEFNYQELRTGVSALVEHYSLRAAELATDASDDWTIVPIAGDANHRWGSLELVDASMGRDTHVNIIQHPGGGPKQIALYHNQVEFADDRIVQYLTDTLPGSSGSPVFNDDWKVVALHHAGGWLQQPGTKSTFFRNEGIRSRILLQALQAIPGR